MAFGFNLDFRIITMSLPSLSIFKSRAEFIRSPKTAGLFFLSDQEQSLASVEFLDGKSKDIFKRKQVKMKSGDAITTLKPWAYMVLERH